MRSTFEISSLSFNPCVIIPVYNHAQAISKTVQDIEYLGINCILINDGSTDGGQEVMSALAQTYSWVEILERSHNGGKGAAVKDAIRLALMRGYSHALQLDADGQHDSSLAKQFLSLAQEHPQALVIGAPIFGPDAPRSRRWGREISNLLCWLETGSMRVRDVLCGYRVYPIRRWGNFIVEKVRSQRMEFDPEVVTRLCWQGIEVVNVPTSVTYPQDGISHFRMRKDNFLIGLMHMRILFNLLKNIFPR